MKYLLNNFTAKMFAIIMVVIASTYFISCEDNSENNSAIPVSNNSTKVDTANNDSSSVQSNEPEVKQESVVDMEDDFSIGSQALEESQDSYHAWPENEFTANLPYPEFISNDVLSSTTKDSFAIVFYNPILIDDATAYINSVKDFGYTINATEETNNTDNYTYVAENQFGYKVTVIFYKSMFSITLDKIS